MLFTRCPKCETTFRITKEALRKAAGQVRCGRCSHIFDARGDLRERVDAESAIEPAPPPDRRQNKPPIPADRKPPQSEGEPITTAPAEPSLDDHREAEHIVLESADSVDFMPADTEKQMSADEIQAVLTKTPPKPGAMPAWVADTTDDASNAGTKSRWTLAAIVVLVLLIGQTLNHYRAEFADLPIVGAVFQETYGFFGIDLSPHWDLEQYEVVDSVAIAEPGEIGQSNLVIRSRIRNAGPRDQPYPHIQLKLLDRWEATVASRAFSPGEYLGASTDRAALMTAGTVTEARLVIVDPGPDASGFELDVCVTIEEQLSCAADLVFD